MGKAKLISIINYKGGVGKTVSAFNIAAGLNFLNGHSVLLIDLDPQCSLSRVCLTAYNHKKNKTINLEGLSVNETINHVFRSYLNQEILDFEFKIDTKKLIKSDFYTGDNFHLKNFDFIPATLFMPATKGYIRGLDEIEGDIRCQYSYDAHAQLKQTTILAKFFKQYAIDEKYDFILFDCPPSNNIITQNALLISDYYLVPMIMDELGSQGVKHVNNIIQNTFIHNILNEYQSVIDACPETSYLSILKKGKPTLLGIFETLKKPTSNTEAFRSSINKDFPNQLFSTIIYNQVDVQESIKYGKCCFTSCKRTLANPTNKCYGNLVYEILDRLSVKRDSHAHKITDIL